MPWNIVSGSESWQPWGNRDGDGWSLSCIVQDDEGHQTEFSFSTQGLSQAESLKAAQGGFNDETALGGLGYPNVEFMLTRRFRQVKSEPEPQPEPKLPEVVPEVTEAEVTPEAPKVSKVSKVQHKPQA